MMEYLGIVWGSRLGRFTMLARPLPLTRRLFDAICPTRCLLRGSHKQIASSRRRERVQTILCTHNVITRFLGVCRCAYIPLYGVGIGPRCALWAPSKGCPDLPPRVITDRLEGIMHFVFRLLTVRNGKGASKVGSPFCMHSYPVVVFPSLAASLGGVV